MAKRIVFRGRTRKQRRAVIEAIVCRWRERLLLDHWSFDVILLREPPADPSIARVTLNERYNDGVIEIHPDFWNHPRETQNRVLLHELVHALTNRIGTLGKRGKKRLLLDDELTDAEENLTERITNIVWDAYEDRT